ncbi:MAG TPA: glycoside hydrolase family 92 protein [Clostridiales bacterium]|nr:glycoside hydrolase family 92 protein [Clostridiales bacterium]HQK74332.1 glycoside hydrolase family 92 protein [Clostridiales bacterium]
MITAKKTDFVDPFFGSEVFRFRNSDFLSERWFHLKPHIGNLSPAACLPYNALNVVPYSGCYPTGWGVRRASSSSVPRMETRRRRIKGFTHYSVSGTGFIDEFYNFFLVSPVRGGRMPAYEALREEKASPGYYYVRAENFTAEVTLTRDTACYNIVFHTPGDNRILLDPGFGGLDLNRPGPARAGKTSISVKDGCAAAEAVFEAHELYAFARLERFEKVEKVKTGGVEYISARLKEGETQVSFSVSFSLTAAQKAAGYAKEGAGFAAAREAAADLWERALSVVDIKADDRTQRLFYTCLYNAQKKPVELSHENLITGEGPLYADIATFWDMYKTALPLMALLHPEKYAALVNGLLGIAEMLGGLFPVCVLMERRYDRCNMQARSLAHNLIATARAYAVGGIDYRRALKLMVSDLERGDFKRFRNTHTLDLADAAWFTAKLAEELGESEIPERYRQKAGNWRAAYDEATGLLKQGKDVEYYEGIYANYSFRLSPYIRERIELCGKERYLEYLDRFFGYTRPPVKQYRRPTPDHILAKYAEKCFSFEGLNNEPDMETPYNYIFAGRHDKLCEVVSSAMACRFDLGRGGLPGNDDSGALTSWYVFNALGLFPMAGTDLFFIGSPKIDEAVLHLQRDFTVKVHNQKPGSIYVQKAVLNGRELPGMFLRHADLAAGGVLELTMCGRPAARKEFVWPAI